MITGVVLPSREPVIRLRLRGTNGIEVDIEAVIDTGFTENLTLPLSWITALALFRAGKDVYILADGSSVQTDLYACTVIWDGVDHLIEAHQAEETPLVGMTLMDSYKLVLDAKIGGSLTLTYNP